MNKLFILIILSIIMFPNYSYAYLDPGTGSIILQAIIGFLAASVMAISIYWSKFKSLISRIFNKKKEKKVRVNLMIEEKGSFRDPAGKIFYHKNKVYRKLSNLGKERLKFILEENILEESIKNSFIINSKIVKIENELNTKNEDIILSIKKFHLYPIHMSGLFTTKNSSNSSY